MEEPKYTHTQVTTGKSGREDYSPPKLPGTLNINKIQLFNDATKLLISKTQDYNGDKISKGFDLDDPREDYFPHGLASYHHMLHTKVKRIESLVKSGNNPNHEGIKDSLIDLANYSAFMYSYIRSTEEENEG